jgi:hypothetical protein
MNALRTASFGIPVLLLFALLLQGCGGNSTMLTRQLLSVTISPVEVTAPGSPASQVQFVATGHYNTEPYTVTPLPATWGTFTSPQKIASTTQSGLATCIQGGSGTTAVEAWVQLMPPVCNVIDSAGRPGCGNIGASAQLTCP